MIVKGLIQVGGGPLVFGLLWLVSPPESLVMGAVRVGCILFSQIASEYSMPKMRARFAAAGQVPDVLVLFPTFLLIVSTCLHIYIVAFRFLVVADFEHSLLFPLAIATALISGASVSYLKYGETKPAYRYTFLSTGSIIAVLVFGTLRALDEIVVMSATASDKSFYILAVPILLLALFELIRREFNRPS